MTNIDQAASQTVSPAKQDWMKPEITSFTAAVDAQGAVVDINSDGIIAGNAS